MELDFLANGPRQPRGSTAPRVLAFLDTPNLYYSLTDSTGGDFVPDYGKLLGIAKSRGRVIVATALVNDGFPESRAASLRRQGYIVARSEGKDCDFRLVAEAIARHRSGDIFLICSGDHRFAELTLALRALGKYVIVASAVPACSQKLRLSANEFIPFPAKSTSQQRPSALHPESRRRGNAHSSCPIDAYKREVSL